MLDETGYAFVDQIPFGYHKVLLTTPFGDFDYGVQHFKKGKSLTMNVVIETNQLKKAPKVTVTEEVTPVTAEN